MQNYIIRALRDAGVLRVQDKRFNLNTILFHMSLESNDYCYLVNIFKQHLSIHRTAVTEIHQSSYRLQTYLAHNWSYRTRKSIGMVHEI